MIRLHVTTYNGQPLSQPLSAQFDELGGDIGRADTNQLVLPDPERTVSRVHARVLFRASTGFAIVDQGSNPISVNGQPLGKGVEASIKPGDHLQIGGYVLNVEVASAASGASDPFADFFGLAPAHPATQPGVRRGPPIDPLGLLGSAPPPPQPQPHPAAPAFAPAFAPPPPAAPAASFGGGIPADWDPFAAPPAPRNAPAAAGSVGARALGLDFGAGAPAPLIPDLPGSPGGLGAGGDSLDALFGLGAPTPTSSNPLAQSLLGEAIAQPNMASHSDPLKALGMLPAGAGQALPDTTSELNRPFLPPSLPVAQPPVVPPPANPMAALNKLDPSETLSGAVVSWNPDGAGEGRTIIRAGRKPEAPPAAPVPVAAPAAQSEITVSPMPPLSPSAPPPVALPAPATAPATSATVPADQAALLAAFREGLGLPNLPAGGLTPEFMRLLGQLIHESARGTVDLLVARAALKREVRAEATMIVAKENNPLKFSPTAEVALGHLLGPHVRGFIEPQRAMRDAFDDLRAHQLAFLAGMRAALEGLLTRFDPASLEARLTQKSVLSSLLPAARKAQLWSVFQQEYQQIAGELSDDFHQVFGREFLRAYEAQLDALHTETH
ncbi:type VI secretion system-associated FHA domain protein TagH [Roseateles sp. DC23W]|uniref:Type VI secretion system-associated FHA domain protein TagH n=1 Tax=Pelomonas dachongensis TaxID=3299029 RepID=A0ABW7EK87_9BURK